LVGIEHLTEIDDVADFVVVAVVVVVVDVAAAVDAVSQLSPIVWPFLMMEWLVNV